MKRLGSKPWNKVSFVKNETMDAFVDRIPQRYKVANYTCVVLRCDNFGALTSTNLTDIVRRGIKYVISPIYVFGKFRNIGHLSHEKFRGEVTDLMLELGVGGVVESNQPFYDISVWAPSISCIKEFCKRLVGDVGDIDDVDDVGDVKEKEQKMENNDYSQVQTDKLNSTGKKNNQNIKNGSNDNMSVVSNANDTNNKNKDKSSKNKENNNNSDKNGEKDEKDENDENDEKIMMANLNGKDDKKNKQNDKKGFQPICKIGDNFSFTYEQPTVYFGKTVFDLTRVVIHDNQPGPPADGRLSDDASSNPSGDLHDIIAKFYS